MHISSRNHGEGCGVREDWERGKNRTYLRLGAAIMAWGRQCPAATTAAVSRGWRRRNTGEHTFLGRRASIWRWTGARQPWPSRARRGEAPMPNPRVMRWERRTRGGEENQIDMDQVMERRAVRRLRPTAARGAAGQGRRVAWRRARRQRHRHGHRRTRGGARASERGDRVRVWSNRPRQWSDLTSGVSLTRGTHLHFLFKIKISQICKLWKWIKNH